jgi:hypothetical protein
MSRAIFFTFIFASILFANPYKTLDIDTQLSIFTNHFISEQIKKELPKKPKKEEYVPEDIDLNPGKYERYYNYVQRLKAIEQSKKEALEKIEQKFRGQASYYNGKLDSIKNFYEDEKNLEPLLKKALNNAFKVVYGKPIVEDFQLDGSFAGATLSAMPLYRLENPLNLKLLFDQELLDEKLLSSYEALVSFKRDKNAYSIDEVQIKVDDTPYSGKIKNKNNATFKLNVKINNDIFQKIKLEDQE